MNLKDLRRIDSLKVLSETRRYYAAVASEGIHPTIKVPAKCLRGQGQQETSDDEDGDEEMLIDGDEKMLANQDEEVPADGDEEMPIDEHKEISSGELFQVLHYPVRMKGLFGFCELGKRAIHFVPDNDSRYRTVI